MLNENIKKLRKEKGWTQQKLAEEAKLSFSLITKLEQGVIKEPTISSLVSIADLFKIDIDKLIGRKIK